MIVNGESGIEHETGVASCIACWGVYPRRCDCGGMVHAEFFDESNDDVVLVYRCDSCREAVEPVD